MKGLALFLGLCVLASAQTNLSIGSTALQTGVKKIGVNLGGPTYYGSQQFGKNLFSDGNAGFQNAIVSSTVVCDQGATSTTCATSQGNGWSNGWWGAYTSTMRVMMGSAAGCTSTITSAVQNTYYTFNFSALTGTSPITGSACSSFSTTSANGSAPYISVIKTITAANASTNYVPAQGWSTYDYGSGATFTNNSDAPSSPDSLSVYQNSLDISVPSSDTAIVYQVTDTAVSQVASRQFIVLNGTYQLSFWAKAISGTSPAITYTLTRGSNVLYTHTFSTSATTWTQYTATVPISESNPSGQLKESFSITSAEIRLTNVSFSEPTTVSNPTVFRDAVVSALKDLAPGVIRMWDGATGETSPLDNMLKDQFSRQPVSFNSYLGYPGYYNINSYSIPDFLYLCQTVGSEAWIVIPVTWSPTDMQNFIDYLSGGSSTTYGAKRIAQGYTSPWTSVISHIYLELGNEQWNNGSFQGGITSYNQAGYGAMADTLFAAAKSQPSYVSSAMTLVLGGQFYDSNSIQPLTSLSTHNDMMSIAPYLMNNVTDFSTPNLWQSVLAEPQLIYSPVGSNVCMEYYNYNYTNPCPTEAAYSIAGPTGSVTHQYGGGVFSMELQAMQNSANVVPFGYYEMSIDGNGFEPGSPSQANLNTFLPSLGVGLMVVDEALGGIQHGVKVQNIFQLAQDYYPYSGLNYLIWGIVEDMGGPTNGRRPIFYGAKLANAAISPGGSMLTVTQTGTPTYNLGSPTSSLPYGGTAVNSIAAANIQGVRSYAFSGSNGYGLVILNLTASNQAVTFSGVNAPTGTVTVNTLTSANPSDNNETTTTTVVPATTSVTSPSGYTLPPYSEVVMTWSGAAPAPSLSIACTNPCTPPSIAAAGSVQLSPVNYYIPSFSAASTTWTVSSAVGATVTNNSDGTGTVHLPSGTYFNNQPITVVAANGSYTSPAFTLFTKGTKTPFNPFPLPATHPGINFSASSLTFAAQNTGSSSSPMNVTVTNPGTASTTISGISITGTNSNQYSQSNNCVAVLATTGSCQIAITFSPTATGTQTASVSVVDNASGSPQSIALSGTGQTSSGPSGVVLQTATYTEMLTFSSTVIHSSSASQYIKPYNGSSSPLTLNSMAITGANAADFTFDDTSCRAGGTTSGAYYVLGVYNSCQVNVTFTPQAGSAGTRTATFTMSGSNSDSPLTVSLTGTASSSGGSAAISFSPSSLTFSAQNTGTSSSASNITVTNSGSATLTISSISITGTNSSEFSQTNSGCSSLAPSANCTIAVVFSPTATGTQIATISVASNAPSSPQTVALSGTGQTSGGGTSGVLLQTPSYDGNLAFGTTTGTAERIALYNGSAYTLTITSMTLSGTNAADFQLNSSDCNVSNDSNNPFLSYASGAGCNIYVTFSPLTGSSGTSKAATFTFVGSNSDSPLTVNITGTVP